MIRKGKRGGRLLQRLRKGNLLLRRNKILCTHLTMRWQSNRGRTTRLRNGLRSSRIWKGTGWQRIRETVYGPPLRGWAWSLFAVLSFRDNFRKQRDIFKIFWMTSKPENAKGNTSTSTAKYTLKRKYIKKGRHKGDSKQQTGNGINPIHRQNA